MRHKIGHLEVGLAATALIGVLVGQVGASTITSLGTLGGTQSFGLDINNFRQASGNSSVTSAAASAEGATGSTLRAFSWSNGVISHLGAMPGATTNRFARGYAINDLGVVVGEFNNDSSRAFVYDPGVGTMAGLTRLAGGTDNGVAQDINNAGVIVGISSNGSASRATRWTKLSGVYTPEDLGSIDGLTTTTARANAVNASGNAAGYSRDPVAVTSQATLWRNGSVFDLGSLGDGNRFSQAYGLNNNHVVVGSSNTGQTVGQLIGTTSTTLITRAFVWSEGIMQELAPVNLYSPGNTGTATNYHSVAMDINDAGWIVGNSQRVSGLPAVATLWIGGQPIDLNTLLPLNSGWVLTSAEGINQAGDIVGYGTFNGQTVAYVLSIPEPSVGLVLPLAAMMLRRRSRRN